MQSVAQGWLVYRMTGSAVLLGSVAFASQFPVFLCATIGGTIADRYSRHRILVGTQTASMLLAFCLALLTITERIQVVHILVLAALLGLVNAFDIPARQSFVVQMVGRGDLINAIALNSSLFNGTRIIGPAVAGILVAAIGEGWCFLANALSYLAVIIGLLRMEVADEPRVKKDAPLASVVEGFRYLIGAAPVRSLLVLLGTISLLGMPYVVLMPIFADQILHGGPRGLGILVGSSGIGAFLGALCLAARSRIQGLGSIIASAAIGFGTILIVFSLSRTFWLSALLVVPLGFCMIVEMAATNSLIQALVPDKLRGRAMAVYAMMLMGMAPIGALLAGAVAEQLSAPITVALGGLVCIVAGLIFWINLSAFRKEVGVMILARQSEDGLGG